MACLESTTRKLTLQDFRNMNYPDIKDIILSNVVIDRVTSCWEWEKGRNWAGYGVVFISGKHERAHRISYQLLSIPHKIVPIQDGICVLHRCDNTSCVNPTHLFPGTQKENMKDRDSKGRGVNLVGASHGCSKLTNKEVLEIRDEYKNRTGSYRQLSRKFGVSRGLINKIVNRVLWKHI